MGLDMYLRRKKYIGANYEHRQITGEIKIFQGDKEIPIDLKKVVSIDEHAAYWRKANQIHNWFVENIQDGNDDCGTYTVGVDSLKELLNLCEQIERNPELAEELLPTHEGFFFGSTEYGEYYMEDIKYTIETLREILEEHERLSNAGVWVDYEYSSSW